MVQHMCCGLVDMARNERRVTKETVNGQWHFLALSCQQLGFSDVWGSWNRGSGFLEQEFEPRTTF